MCETLGLITEHTGGYRRRKRGRRRGKRKMREEEEGDRKKL